MKLVKAKTTKRFGGEPYITLPRGAKVENGTSPEPKELTPDEVVSYVVSSYEGEPIDIKVDELPVISNETPPLEGGEDTYYKITYGPWVKGTISKQGSPLSIIAPNMTWRASDDSWGCNFTFYPLCVLNDDLDMLIKVFQVNYTD